MYERSSKDKKFIRPKDSIDYIKKSSRYEVETDVIKEVLNLYLQWKRKRLIDGYLVTEPLIGSIHLSKYRQSLGFVADTKPSVRMHVLTDNSIKSEALYTLATTDEEAYKVMTENEAREIIDMYEDEVFGKKRGSNRRELKKIFEKFKKEEDTENQKSEE